MSESQCGKAARLAGAILLGLMLGAAPVAAQEATATLGGAVKDPSGAVVAGATVTLTDSQTGISRQAKASADGNYLFTLVPIGKYELAAEATGFSKFDQTGIVLDINQNARQDITLQIGSTTQVVEVSGNVKQVDTVSATLGKVETEQRILDLPLVGRDTLQLGLLQAGVFAPDPDDGSGNPFSVSGQRSESLTFLLDGADNNDFLGNNIILSPNPDAVQEFKIITNNYQAEYGRTSGGIVNQVIKSGTNSFHGSGFEFVRNDALNARDFFIPDVTPFKRNVFGGTVGGPIKRDKTFFFASYQGTRRREGQVAPVNTTLTPAERGGDFSSLLASGVQLVNPVTGANYVNNQVPVNPISANYIAKYVPLPNVGTNGFVSAPSGRIRDDQMIYRVDHNFNETNTLSGVYLFENSSDFFPFEILNGASTGGNVPAGSAFTDANRFQTGSITWTHTFGPTLINEARFAANRSAGLTAVPVDHTTPQQLGFTNVNPDDPAGAAPPIMSVTGGFELGPSPQGPTKIHDVTFQWQDTVSWQHGHHSFKFGGDIRRIRNNFDFDFYNNGSFFFGEFGSLTGNSLADFVGGFPEEFFQFSKAIYGIREGSYYGFAQDNWKVRPRLTLDLGLRYEYNSPQTDPHNEIIGYFPGQQSTVFPAAPPGFLYPGDPGTPNQGLVYADRNNFAPRLGFAWDMLGTGRLVMRGGFGIFYDVEDGALNLQFGGQPPFGDVTDLFPANNQLGGNYLADPFTPLGIQNPFPFTKVGTFFVPAISFAYVADPRFRTPYSENFNYGFQYQLTPNTLLETVYVGSLGRKLISTADLNFRNPSLLATYNNAGINLDCARPLSGCSGTTDPNAVPTLATGQILADLSNGVSASHELQVTLDKRLSHGFETRVAYTLSKTTDLTSGFRARSSTFTDPVNYQLDHALADFDATHRLVISGGWQLPFNRAAGSNRYLKKLAGGWNLESIVTFQSGNPFTIFQNNNSSLQNNFLDRPDVLGPIQVFSDPRQNRTFTPTTAGTGSCFVPTDANGVTATGNFFFNPTNLDCATVAAFTFGTLGRNTLRGPGINNWDLSLIKDTQITERQRIEIRAEFFNAFNHAQFSNPDAGGFDGTFGQLVATRGHDSDTTSGARIIQFGIKYYF
ncbi:MAG TPA: carboxypeptidase regulatory-like domain-containing protein [Terriglobia bacterium]|nr:carboxypeptidase regulatory-like domain-containing protein [Terriglobia bacterium]